MGWEGWGRGEGVLGGLRGVMGWKGLGVVVWMGFWRGEGFNVGRRRVGRRRLGRRDAGRAKNREWRDVPLDAIVVDRR